MVSRKTANTKILIVESDRVAATRLRAAFGDVGEPYVALTAGQGLDLMDREGPFAVVVSELRLAGSAKDGVDFLCRVAARSPSSVRILLTSRPDVASCLRAINECHVYRFLEKTEDYADAVAAVALAVDLHNRRGRRASDRLPPPRLPSRGRLPSLTDEEIAFLTSDLEEPAGSVNGPARDPVTRRR